RTNVSAMKPLSPQSLRIDRLRTAFRRVPRVVPVNRSNRPTAAHRKDNAAGAGFFRLWAASQARLNYSDGAAAIVAKRGASVNGRSPRRRVRRERAQPV